MTKKDVLTDEFLIDELKRRLASKNHSLHQQQTMLVELERLNDRLRDVERVKSSFLSNIRNEINNPLTSVIGLSDQLMSAEGVDVEKVKRLSYLINKEAFALDFQLRNIFSAAEIEAGEINIRPAAVNIEELIFSQIKYLTVRAAQSQVIINSQAVQVKAPFQTDPFILQSIVMNILANAIEFSPKGGEVVVTAKATSNNLILVVQDFGEGISENQYKHVFDRFRQLESGTTKKHQGHGLGLAIVREFIDSLRGRLDIHSEKGRTTIITIELPRLAEDMTPEGFSDGNEIIFSEEEIL